MREAGFSGTNPHRHAGGEGECRPLPCRPLQELRANVLLPQPPSTHQALPASHPLLTAPIFPQPGLKLLLYQWHLFLTPFLDARKSTQSKRGRACTRVSLSYPLNCFYLPTLAESEHSCSLKAVTGWLCSSSTPQWPLLSLLETLGQLWPLTPYSEGRPPAHPLSNTVTSLLDVL